MKDQNNENKPATVAATPQQAGEAHDRWWWVERSVWTERMLKRLTQSEPANRVWFRLVDKTYERMVCAPWAAVLGSRTRVDAFNRGNTNPLTGEPDAGDPPVRFGGRGGALRHPYPYRGAGILPAGSGSRLVSSISFRLY